MAVSTLLTVSILVSFFAITCYGNGILFSSLQNTLVVATSTTTGQVLKAGDEQITITWTLNPSLSAGTDSSYNRVRLNLCFAPISQVERKWRRTENELKKDKSCQFKIETQSYTAAANHSYTWTIERDVPTGSYFVRAYALNAEGHEVAYGQSSDAHRTTNLFNIQAITGRHLSLDIASVCFSAFSVVSLAFFFILEKRKARASSK
jgi:hypothetical protein